ncbi:MAG TPA: DsbA family protein [Dermatophilaceae bacterium]|nr:DsbA family protein [Dermatophilaceae bacterium]
MTSISFWLDPGCPWTWRTSRWLRSVAAERGINIDWHVMSLAVLNEGREIPQAYREKMAESWRLVRLLAAAEAEGGPLAVGRLYDAVGTTIHEEGHQPDDNDVAMALEAAGLPRDLTAARDDTSYDAAVRDSHARGQERVGTESGSPVIAIDDGPGFFGPVVTAPPDDGDAERLLDALILLSAVPTFSELKRAR